MGAQREAEKEKREWKEAEAAAEKKATACGAPNSSGILPPTLLRSPAVSRGRAKFPARTSAPVSAVRKGVRLDRPSGSPRQFSQCHKVINGALSSSCSDDYTNATVFVRSDPPPVRPIPPRFIRVLAPPQGVLIQPLSTTAAAQSRSTSASRVIARTKITCRPGSVHAPSILRLPCGIPA